MSRKMPPLNPLRAFEVAARHLSFTRAAQELFVTAAAVSHQVKTLEENLGIALFTRLPKSLQLTDAGKTYLPGVRQAFKQLAEATHQLQHRVHPSTLKVNLPPTFAVKWLIPRMERFIKAHPDLDLEVSTSNHPIDFSRDRYDLAIRYGKGKYPGTRSELCFDVEVFPVCSPVLLTGSHPLLRPEDLKFHTLLHDESRYRDVNNPTWADWLHLAGVPDIDSSRGPSFWPSHLVLDAATDGLGVALAKKRWVESDLAEGKLVRPFSLALPVDYAYYIVYPEERSDDVNIMHFVAWIRSEVTISPA
jgi:LysR family transcriptional regulator, glycine cleavage system transcriptional activator